MFLDWRDIIEIVLCTTGIYWFCKWLKKDKRHNLLPYFYSYCCTFALAHILSLTTISFIMLALSPIIIMLFILFHQELLQRNFITAKKVSPTILHEDWIEFLFRISLIQINKNKEIHFIIEQTDDLKPFLVAPFYIALPIQLPILELITESSLWNQNQLVWVTKEGILQAINIQSNFSIDNAWQSDSVKELSSLEQDALALTLKTDALYCKADPITRSFDVIIRGKIYELLPAHSALALLKKQLKTPFTQGESKYDISHQRESSFQQNS